MAFRLARGTRFAQKNLCSIIAPIPKLALMERHAPATTRPLLEDNAGFPIDLIQKQGKKLILWKHGTRLATLACFNGALFMRIGDSLHPLNPGLHIIPGVKGLVLELSVKGLNFRVGEETSVGFEVDHMSNNDIKSWNRIQNEKKSPVNDNQNNLKIAVALVLSGLAIGAAALSRGCDAHAEAQDAVSEE